MHCFMDFIAGSLLHDGHDVFYLLSTDAITNDLLGTLRTGRVRPLQSPAIALNT